MSRPDNKENLMSLADQLLWGMETYGVSTELFGASSYVGFNTALEPKDNYFLADGVQDEVAINAAEAYVTALGGGSVELERGTYTMQAPIVPTGDDIWYKGQGMDTFLNGDALLTTEHVFHITARDNIRISDMSMQTENGGGKTSHCIFLENGSDDFHIHDVDIMDSDDNGIHIEGTTTSRGHIHNCRFEGTDGHGIYVDMDGGEYAYAFRIIDNYMAGIGNAGIFFETSGGNAYCLIEGNIIFSPSGIGIYMNIANQCQILGNQCILSANLSGIHIQGSTELTISDNMCVANDRHGIFLTVTNQCLVDGNTCNTNDASDSNSYDGINLDTTCSENIISNNICDRNHNRGITIRGPQNIIVGNKAVENDREGIYVNNVDNMINDNRVADNGQDSAGTYNGIHLSTTAGRCMIEDNYVDGYGDSQEDGIYLETTVHNCHIEGNYCYDGMGSGITVEDDNDNTIIIGNFLYNNDDYGVEILTANAVHTMVRSNHFDGNGAACVLNNGTGSTFHTKQYYVARDDDNIGVVPGKSITIGQTAYIALHAPEGMHQLMGFNIYVIPNATQAAADWDLETDYGAIGEAYNTHEEAEAAATYNVTNNQWFAIDAFAAGMLAALVAEDTGGISVTVGTVSHNVTVVMAEMYFV